MQEIITKILEKLHFPTKNVEALVASLETWDIQRLLALSVMTNDTEIVAYRIDHHVFILDPEKEKITLLSEWRTCSLGSELVAGLKGGEG